MLKSPGLFLSSEAQPKDAIVNTPTPTPNFGNNCQLHVCACASASAIYIFLLKGSTGWGANPGSFVLIYFLIPPLNR
jgi:hypothetical protein